jgi:1,4-alpha-glucan branching enzyme
VDGLRVDAVASMLYLDYARTAGEWVPNPFGGRENLEAIAFLQRFNEVVHQRHPGAVTIAEESTAWPMVSRRAYAGGLGFDYKWNMGWMHDLLDYMSHEPVYRRFHHTQLTFGLLYAWHENFILPLSHDEVVYGKGSLHHKMPGDDWQKFANLRSSLRSCTATPGRSSCSWGPSSARRASGTTRRASTGPCSRRDRIIGDSRRWSGTSTACIKASALSTKSTSNRRASNGSTASVVSFVRRAKDSGEFVLVVANFTPVPRLAYRVGAPRGGYYRELLNTVATVYGGSGLGNAGGAWAEPQPWQRQPCSLVLTLPPLTTLVLKPSSA